MASPVLWIRQLSGASLDLSHSDLVRYRCYNRKSVGRASLATGVYMIHGTWCVCVCVCVYMYLCTRVYKLLLLLLLDTIS